MITQDQKDKAKNIMELALKLTTIHKSYANVEFIDKVKLSAKILEIEQLNEIYIMLVEIDQSILDGYIHNNSLDYFKQRN
jgi:hypothetical protein